MNEQGLSKSENAFFSEAKLQRKLKQVKSVLVELGYRGEECEIYTYIVQVFNRHYYPGKNLSAISRGNEAIVSNDRAEIGLGTRGRDQCKQIAAICAQLISRTVIRVIGLSCSQAHLNRIPVVSCKSLHDQLDCRCAYTFFFFFSCMHKTNHG